ncbi:unnamed protein product [Amaranthus hypochondriacus]
MEVVVASSSTDETVGCWDIHTGAEQLRYKSCISPSHGLISIAGRFLASSQNRKASTSGSVFYWSWHKPQPEVKSFPAESIKPLVSNREGTYLFGGGSLGYIYLWEVFTGRLLKKWHAHIGAVSCLAMSDDESLLISGAEDGGVRVWSLFMMFDDARRKEARHDFVYSFRHNVRVTDVKSGHGGSNAVIISASEDLTCKVWSLATGRLLRNVTFPSVINAIAIDVGEYAFYAGGRDGKIYIAALNAVTTRSADYGNHIIGLLHDSSRAVNSLAFCADGISLVSGSEDGKIRIWNTRTRNIVRMFRHSKDPVNNILVTSLPESASRSQTTSARKTSILPPPLEKYANSSEEPLGTKVFIGSDISSHPVGVSYLTEDVMNKQIKDMQQKGSTTAAEMEVERLKLDNTRAMQMAQQWKKMYDNLHEFCVNELVDDSRAKHSDANSG